MAVTITTKQWDTKITFKDTPTIDDVVVLPADLAGCTLKFIMKNADGSILVEKVRRLMVMAHSAQPVVADDEHWEIRQEWEVKYPDNKELTFPNNGYNIVKILESLNLT